MKIIGILGGLGPETTAHFYLDIVSLCKEAGLTERPPVLIWSIPLSYELEKRFITTGDGIDGYRSFLLEGAKKLEKGGAEFIVIPCNSVHTLIEDVRKAVSVPVLSIVEETVTFLAKQNVSGIGLLATTPTLQSRLYQNFFEENNIHLYIPPENEQTELDDLIQKLALSESGAELKQTLGAISRNLFQKGADALLLACTDLQLLMNNSNENRIYDTETILAHSVVNYFRK